MFRESFSVLETLFARHQLTDDEKEMDYMPFNQLKRLVFGESSFAFSHHECLEVEMLY
jgi:hypothetical protein